MIPAMTRRHPTPTPLARLAAVLVVALAATACGTADPSATPTPVPTIEVPGTADPEPTPVANPAATPAPSSDAAITCDETVTGSPAVSDDNDPNAPVYDAIEAQVQDLRGVEATTPIARGVFDQASLCAYLRTSFREDNPADLISGTETLYKHLLLMPEDESLEQLYLDLLTSQVAGLYDDDDKKMYVVTADGGIGPAEEITYAHEFTHALQDQRFGLKQLMGEDFDQSDRQMARAAVVEGDATLLMSLWAQQNLTAAELGEVASTVDPASQAVLDRMPAMLKEPLLFPYTQGLTLALAAFTQGGGYAGVDALYDKPPASTEQVLHPEKLEAREAPVAVAIPDDLATRLGDGWKVSLQDTLGELLLGILLKEGGASATGDAAAGWGGDRLALIEGPGGEVAVMLDTAWDTKADADEFTDAIDQTMNKLVAAGRSAGVFRPSAERVILVSAADADTFGRLANVLGLAG
jgi:hypothetical protein